MDEDHSTFSRRSVLAGAATAAAGLAGGGAVSAEERVSGNEYEETDYGYVRTDYTPPEGEDRPAVLAMDGYAGATGSGPATHYVEMRDGTLIAVRVNASGYPSPFVRDEYVEVHASIRGTGCSGGAFTLYDGTQGKDGHELVEWLADRDWALDRVGLFGRSFSGMTAFDIASTAPPSLGAVCANAPIADLYRGIVFPGGVPNAVFTSIWPYALRPAQEGSGVANGLQGGDEICVQNIAARDQHHPTDEEVFLYTRRTDDATWRSRSLIERTDGVEAPLYISHAFQDEQVGPRGGVELFHATSPKPASPPGLHGAKHRHEEPKLLRSSNGSHDVAGTRGQEEAEAFFDYWLLGIDNGIMESDPVTVGFNVGTDAATELGFEDFPVPGRADYQRLYFDEGGSLSTTKPTAESASDRYITGSPRRALVSSSDAGTQATLANGPDMLRYGTTFDEPTVMAGSSAATLEVASTAPEFDLFVSVADQAPDGTITPLQRGLLRASHRDLTEFESLYAEGEVARPYHPHTNPEQPVPGETNTYTVEIWPVGHIFYPGHRLLVTVTTPPLADGLWGYEPSRALGLNTVHRSADAASSIYVPLLEWPRGKPLPTKPEPGAPAGYRGGQPITDGQPVTEVEPSGGD